MNAAWAIRLRRAEFHRAAHLRLMSDVEILQSENDLWLRGAKQSEEIDAALRRLAPIEWFVVWQDGTLTRKGERIPSGRMPEGAWSPISSFIILEPQPAALPAKVQRVPLTLIRSDAQRLANVLVTAVGEWTAYAVNAPQIRLRGLRFAADENRALIHGSPLPPLPGDLFVEQDGVGIPCGWEISPAVASALVNELLKLAAGDMALMASNGSVEIIPASCFVPARRSAIRLLLQGTADAAS